VTWFNEISGRRSIGVKDARRGACDELADLLNKSTLAAASSVWMGWLADPHHRRRSRRRGGGGRVHTSKALVDRPDQYMAGGYGRRLMQRGLL